MKPAFPFAAVLLLASAMPLVAQAPAPGTPAPAVFSMPDVQRATPSGAGRLHEVRGTLVSDRDRQQVMFTSEAQQGVVIPYVRITALHYEEAKYPKRSFWRSNYYITIHFMSQDDRPATETLHFVSRDDALLSLAALGRDTTVPIDRTPATRSIVGIPVHAGVGSKVVVTDTSGRRVKGIIGALSPTMVEVNGPAGQEWRFDETNLQRIRWPYSARHDATVGVVAGAAFGVFSVWLGAGLSGCYEEGAEDCHVARAMAVSGVVLGGIGAGAASAIGAARYPLNGTFDVFQRAPQRRAGAHVEPRITPASAALVVSVGF